jgi:hypothetical protein
MFPPTPLLWIFIWSPKPISPLVNPAAKSSSKLLGIVNVTPTSFVVTGCTQVKPPVENEPSNAMVIFSGGQLPQNIWASVVSTNSDWANEGPAMRNDVRTANTLMFHLTDNAALI